MKFFKDNSYDIVRLYINNLGISIFALMLYFAAGNIAKESASGFKLVISIFSIGFLIIDFPAAIAFGMFIGMLNLVPYLQVVSVLPMALLAMLKAANTAAGFWPIMLGAVAVMLVVQLIQDLFLVPKIMGKRMNLHPAVILLSLSVWGHLLGVLGMIVALPLTTLLLAYLRRYNEIAETSGSSEEYILKEAIDSTRINRKKKNAAEPPVPEPDAKKEE